MTLVTTCFCKLLNIVSAKPHLEHRIHNVEFALAALYQFLFNKRCVQAIDIRLGAKREPIEDILGRKTRMNASADVML